MEWAEQRNRVEAALDYSEEVIAEKVTEEKLQETFRLLLGGVARDLANLDQGPDFILEHAIMLGREYAALKKKGINDPNVGAVDWEGNDKRHERNRRIRGGVAVIAGRIPVTRSALILPNQ